MSRVVAFVSGKGGVGKTILSAAFGVAAARAGKRVLLLDLDMGMGNLDLALGLSPKYSMLGLLMGKCREKDALLSVMPRLDFLAAHFKKDWRDIKKSDVSLILKEYADEYDLILLDCPAGMGKGVEFAARAADTVYLLIGPSVASLRSAKRMAMQFPETNVQALYNDFSTADEVSFAEARAQTERISFGGLIPHSDAVNRLAQQGRLWEYEETFPFAQAVDKIMEAMDSGAALSEEEWISFLKKEKTGTRGADDETLSGLSRLHRMRLGARYGKRGRR